MSFLAFFTLDSISSGNWQQLIYLVSLTGSVSLCHLHSFHESPRFYLVKRQFDKAFTVINECIMTNSPNAEPLSPEEKESLRELYSQRVSHDSTSYRSLFQEQHLFTTLASSTQWFGINFLSYGGMFIFPLILKQMDE